MMTQRPVGRVVFALLLVASLIGNLAQYVRQSRAKTRATATQPASVERPLRRYMIPTQATEQKLSKADLADYVARLRSMGLPERTIRLVIADLIPDPSDAVAAKWARRPFWKTNAPDPRAIDEIKAAGAERAKLLVDLLGPEPIRPESEYETVMRLNNYGRMSREKVATVVKLSREFEEIRDSMLRGGKVSEDLREKVYQQVQVQLEDQLAQVLTPEELEDYRIRRSSTARTLGPRLDNVDVTEDEYRALFRASKEFDRARGETLALPSAEKRLRTSELALQREDEMRAVLGDDRYLEVARSVGVYVDAFRVAAIEAGAPYSSTQLINANRNVASARSEALRILADHSLSEEAARAKLVTLQQQLNHNLQETLGTATYALFANGRYAGEIKALPDLARRTRN